MKFIYIKRAQACPSLCKYFATLLLILFSGKIAHTQTASNAVYYWNNEMAKITYAPQAPGSYKFKPGLLKDGANFFERYKTAFGLGAGDLMKLVKRERDKEGIVHYRFQQYYKGIRIEGAEYLLHEKNGFLSSAHGKIVYGLNKPVNPKITESSALNKALQLVPAAQYKNPDNKIVSGNNYHPSGELVFQKVHTDTIFAAHNFRLCYHFNIYKATGEGFKIYIDALSGEMVSKIPLQSNCSAASTSTNFYGSKTIYTNNFLGTYYMEDNCTSANIKSYDVRNSLLPDYTHQYTSATNKDWSSTADRKSASTSFWCCRRVVDFYSDIFNRDSYDNAGGDITIFQNSAFQKSDGTINYNNASMDYFGIMRVGNAGNSDNTDDYNTLDIIGHEFTHAITYHSSNLTYQGESGALNESYSDIIGTYIEYWDGNTQFDWLIGEDRGDYLRNMQFPKNRDQPDTYKGVNWITSSSDDHGGVHTNSGVQNHWFYLLSQGGASFNDNDVLYHVDGLNIATAAFIAYKTDAYYLTSSDQYIDARTQSIQAAEDNYGTCSNAAIQTGEAWYAVGVGGSQTSSPENVCGNIFAISFPLNFSGTDVLDVSNKCTATLNPSSFSYVFTSAKTIDIHPGFHALPGTNADFYIHPCDITNDLIAIQSPQQQNMATENPGMDGKDVTNKHLRVYPNPVNALLNIEFDIEQGESSVKLEICNMAGVKVKELSLGYLPPGKQNVRLNLGGLASGIYNVRLIYKKEQLNTRIVLIK